MTGTTKRTAWIAGVLGMMAAGPLAAAPGDPPAADAPGVEVTVYNQDLALVKDRRNIAIPEDGIVQFRNVPARIDATSVHVRSLTDPEGTHVLEQNYEFDLVSAARLMERYLDQTVQVLTQDGELHEGTLMSFEGESAVLRTAGGLEVVARGENIRTIRLPTLPEGLLTRPTLVWQLATRRPGEQLAEVSYLTGGLSWQADYVAIVDEAETHIDLSAWVTLTNRSGAPYEDARLKLIAGDVHRDMPDPRNLMRAEMARAAAGGGFESQPFFEFHMYTLPRTTTIRDNQIKQIALIDPVSGVGVTKRYYYAGSMGEKVQVRVEFENAQANRLGMPLPAGRVRLSKADHEGALQFIGEDRIDHTPRDEKVELTLGNAFDLVGERVVVEQRQLGPRSIEQVIEYRLRNHKDAPVEIIVIETMHPNATIVEFPADLTREAKDAMTTHIPVTVPPGADGRTFRMRVRISN